MHATHLPLEASYVVEALQAALMGQQSLIARHDPRHGHDSAQVRPAVAALRPVITELLDRLATFVPPDGLPLQTISMERTTPTNEREFAGSAGNAGYRAVE